MKMNRGSSSGSDDDVVDLFLPHDIMVGILVLVPPRFLLRLKLVCKSWRSLIAHPDFIRLHLDHSITNKNPLLLISAMNYKAERQVLYSLNFFDDNNDHDHGVRLDPIPHSTTAYQSKRYWGSCNGLLCAMIQKKQLAVWNPCTHEYHRAPVVENGAIEAFGFGYDSTTDYYKIIQIKLFHLGAARRRRLVQTQVLVYTLGLTDSWEPLGSVPFEVSPEHEGLFLNGGLHWIATTACGIGMIICIDIASEEYREISKPESVSINRDDTMDDDNGNVKLMSLKGLLCITNYVTDEKSIEVWAMMEYFNGYDEPSSWSKLFTIKEPLMALPNPGLKFFQPMSGICSKDGDEIIVLVNTARSKSLVWYNMKNDKTKTIILKAHHHTIFPFLQFQTCIESLVPLNTGYYNMYKIEEWQEEEEKEEEEEEERQRILRPWKKQKKNVYL